MPKGIYDRSKSKPRPPHSEETKRKIGKANSIALKGKNAGEKNWRYKGGKKNKKGYIFIYKPEHPFCTIDKYVFKHRLVVEQQIGRYLLPKETSHHINKIKDDNRIENLMAFVNNSAHIRFHKDPNNVKPSEIIFDGRTLQPLN
jgi:hypothetical protein